MEFNRQYGVIPIDTSRGSSDLYSTCDILSGAIFFMTFSDENLKTLYSESCFL